jgi:hypothetical protein
VVVARRIAARIELLPGAMSAFDRAVRDLAALVSEIKENS